MKYQSVAIDGPSGAGKSTLARLAAEALGFLYVDTGAIYRTVGLCAFRRGIPPTGGEEVAALLASLMLDLRYGDDGFQHMYLDGEDVSQEIRRPEISKYASGVSAVPAVRAFLLERQRELARHNNVIMDGRDIGTVVLPDADVKIFLTASDGERARRRYDELCAKGEQVDYETVLADLRERDARDSSRAAAPLRQAEDALLVDTTGKSLEESLTLLLERIKEHLRV